MFENLSKEINRFAIIGVAAGMIGITCILQPFSDTNEFFGLLSTIAMT